MSTPETVAFSAYCEACSTVLPAVETFDEVAPSLAAHEAAEHG